VLDSWHFGPIHLWARVGGGAERAEGRMKVGRHVRIPESAVREFIAANTVEPIVLRPTGLRRAA
jgi:hypothetical protein